MGLLTEGKSLSPVETLELSAYVRDHGVTQFLVTWNRVKDIQDDELRFGDEIEVGIVKVDKVAKTVKICVKSAEIRNTLIAREKTVAHQSEGVTWHPEFGGWMIESTPSRPYTNYAADLLRVERNMVLRRRRLLSVLSEDEIAPTVTCFPMLGVGDFIDNPLPFDSNDSKSIYLPDYIINPHPRFAALTRNIRHRRGGKVDIKMPLFRDVNTPEYLRLDSAEKTAAAVQNAMESPHIPFAVSAASLSGANGVKPEIAMEVDTNIHMDAMAFGMGMCCLQVTFQGRDVDESRYMYDQLAVLAPIMLAMTAATPIFKGRLANVDCRWNAIAQSVDDRTPTEREEVPAGETPEDGTQRPYMAGGGAVKLPKSRYGSISTFIYHCKGDSHCHRTFKEYNDILCPVDEKIKARLRDAGVDENLAHHVSHLFTRDPLVIFDGMVELDDETTTDHFENIQSTNWQTCRWKPPPPRMSPEDPHIGWRTEFRSMEVQLTDFENAAFTVFVALVTRVVLAFDLALYIPLSKVDENMERAHEPNSVVQNKFFFRKFLAPVCVPEMVAASKSSESNGTTSHTDLPIKNACGSNAEVAMAVASVGSAKTDDEVESPPLHNKDLYYPCGAPRESVASSSTNGVDNDSPSTDSSNGSQASSSQTSMNSCEEMTMDEIFNGKGKYYPGLIPLVYAYLDYIRCDSETFKRVDQYLQFISARAKGEIMTPATWMRSFVTSHKAYKQDSVITPEIAVDLMIACHSIGDGSLACPELLGNIKIKRVLPEDAYGHVLEGRLNPDQRSALLQSLVNRAHVKRPDNVARGRRGTAQTIPSARSFNELMSDLGL